MSSRATTPYDKRRVSRFLTHLICLCLLFFLPEVMMTLGSPRRAEMPVCFFYIKPLLYCVAFYLNYYIIIDRTLGRRYGMWRFAGWNALLVVVLLTSLILLSHHYFPSRPHEERFNIARALGFMLRDGVFVVLTISLAVALKMSDKWLNLDRRQQELQVSRREEELKSLKSQLNPHFLFNTLNTIYALIAVSPSEAQDAVHRLSKLLRYVLYENPAMVKLSAEIDFARNYIALMENRLPAGSVETEFASEAESDVYVPPLLFIVLIENAFKHGNAARGTEPIRIAITRGSDGSIVCRTRNRFAKHVEELGIEEVGKTSKLPNTQTSHLPNSHTTNLPNSPKGGIGISNLRRRLHLIYGDAASLETKADGDIYTATLTIHTKKSLS